LYALCLSYFSYCNCDAGKITYQVKFAEVVHMTYKKLLLNTFIVASVAIVMCCLIPSTSYGKPVGSYFNDARIPDKAQNQQAKDIINQIISTAGGFSRWTKVRTISQTIKVDFFKTGKSEYVDSTTERFLFKKDKNCTFLSNSVIVGNSEIVYATNGCDTWVTKDGLLIENDDSNEKALRRLRESWFWLRFPFSLKQKGTTARVGGSGTIHGGRTAVWHLDILPAKRGDKWPNGFIRLVVNKRNGLIEGIIYPESKCTYGNLRAVPSNLCSVKGISLPHTKEIYDNDGLLARETITGRTYNICIPERYFQKPVFEVW